MSPIGSTTRVLASREAGTPTGALRFVSIGAYLTVNFAVLRMLETNDFVSAMAVFSTGALLAALSVHLRLVAAGRFAEGHEAHRNSLSRVSLQVLVVSATTSAVAVLAGGRFDLAPALALAITGLLAGAVRVATSVASARTGG